MCQVFIFNLLYPKIKLKGQSKLNSSLEGVNVKDIRPSLLRHNWLQGEHSRFDQSWV